MDNIEKTILIIEQIRQLDLEQTPVFTWDEMEAKIKKELYTAAQAMVIIGAFIAVLFFALGCWAHTLSVGHN